jgi:hypothetical protein
VHVYYDLYDSHGQFFSGRLRRVANESVPHPTTHNPMPAFTSMADMQTAATTIPAASSATGSAAAAAASSRERTKRSKWGPPIAASGDADNGDHDKPTPTEADVCVVGSTLKLGGLPVSFAALSSSGAGSNSSCRASENHGQLGKRTVGSTASDGERSVPEQTTIRKKTRLVIKPITSSNDLTCLPADDDSTHSTAASGETDAKGFYRCKISEVLDGNYRVMSILGEGVFASVVRCIPLHSDHTDLVAIKVSCFSLLFCICFTRFTQIIRKRMESLSCGEKELEMYAQLTQVGSLQTS